MRFGVVIYFDEESLHTSHRCEGPQIYNMQFFNIFMKAAEVLK